MAGSSQSLCRKNGSRWWAGEVWSNAMPLRQAPRSVCTLNRLPSNTLGDEMMKSMTIGGALFVLGAGPLVANAQSIEAGFHGGSTRIDNGYFGTWIENADYDYAVCGGDTPFVSAFSVNEKGLWNNSVLCSAYAIDSLDVSSYVAQPEPNDGRFTPTNNDARGRINDTTAVADCGGDGVVIGVAQPSGDRVAPAGTAVLCGKLPAPTNDCRTIQTPSRTQDYVIAAGETGALDWTNYPSVTCGPGRFAQAIAYRRYATAELDSQVVSYAMGGLVCCSIEGPVMGPRETRWDPPQNP
jgi:hypothetical protein